jgi:hypothetical protein
MYQYCEICGKTTQHRHLNNVHSVDSDIPKCSVCGNQMHVHKHIPSFIGFRGHGLGGF